MFAVRKHAVPFGDDFRMSNNPVRLQTGDGIPVKAATPLPVVNVAGNASLASIADIQADTRLIDHNQVAMTGSAVQLSATSKVYKRLILSPHPDAAADMFAGKTGVTILTGEYVSALAPVEYINVDISTVYVIGTASDKVCWRGEY